MSLRSELLAVLNEFGFVLGRSGRAALDSFVHTVRQENQQRADDDEEDDDGDVASSDRFVAVRAIACPHCGERISVPIDLSGGDQDVIQDCEVCCSPIRIVYSVSDGQLGAFSFEAS
jgi:hypothetical protein